MKNREDREIAGLAVRSLLLEASLAPKPGLVTPYDNGSHKDMNFKTFVDSALALAPCFENCAAIGRALASSSPETALPSLKEAGLEGERLMFRATGGVNTHKGAIYLLGFLCAAAGRFAATRQLPSPRELTRTATAFVRGAVERELAPLRSSARPARTAGERAYLAHGLTGARGEVDEGYPLLSKTLSFLGCLPPMSLKNTLTDAFFYIVSRNGDTNLYARGGIEGLRTARALAGEVLRSGGTRTPAGWKKIRFAERVFVEKNLSPGGSADILSSVIFTLCGFTFSRTPSA
ncbi:MAG: triphosphoribosyl-dephospho-CoA synthase [Synergistaceae bacterium]|jgi:triphosphoribosyl-dephospho-CoA synthetase|nr:triphosphoribosyl-dephospho-CoA synthase [Synergistaceae bacterium]